MSKSIIDNITNVKVVVFWAMTPFSDTIITTGDPHSVTTQRSRLESSSPWKP